LTVSRRTTIIVLVVVAVVSIIAALYTPTLLHWNKSKYGDVSVQEAKDLIAKKPDLVILDVRTASEFSDGHIEGAINIPVEELSNRLSELSKSDELLVYCRTGNRSATAVSILEDAGFTKIYHMHEGISTWIQEGYSVVQ
jgi:rhodanese-related sulfurtransferase